MLFISVFVMLSRTFIAAMWSPAWKGLTSWLLFVRFYCVFGTFPCGILVQVWYLIVFIPDLCHLFYFTDKWCFNEGQYEHSTILLTCIKRYLV